MTRRQPANRLFLTRLRANRNAFVMLLYEPMFGVPYNLFAPYMSLYMAELGRTLNAVSPLATLQRGYAILTTDDGRTVSSITDVEPDETIIARLIDGDIAAAVIDVEPHEHDHDKEHA